MAIIKNFADPNTIQEMNDLKKAVADIVLPKGTNQRLHEVFIRIFDDEVFMVAAAELFTYGTDNEPSLDEMLKMADHAYMTRLKGQIAGIIGLTMAYLDL